MFKMDHKHVMRRRMLLASIIVLLIVGVKLIITGTATERCSASNEIEVIFAETTAIETMSTQVITSTTTTVETTMTTEVVTTTEIHETTLETRTTTEILETTTEVVSTTEILEKATEKATEMAITNAETVKETAPNGEISGWSDLEILARVINSEAGGIKCSTRERYYVGEVFFNRVQHELFPNTFYEVLTQERQYACVNDGNIWKEPSEECWQIANNILNGAIPEEYRIPSNCVGQSMFSQFDGVYTVTENGIYICYKN